MDKLKELLALCHRGVILEINEHRGYCESPEKSIQRFLDGGYEAKTPEEEIGKVILDKIKETDTLIKLQVYPKYSSEFIILWHYDLDTIIETMIGHIRENNI